MAPTRLIGEIMKTDAKLRSLTCGITTPRRLLIGEIMKIDAKLRSLTGGIMTPKRLLIVQSREQAPGAVADRWNHDTQAVADW